MHNQEVKLLKTSGEGQDSFIGGKFQEVIVEIGIELDCLQMFFVLGLMY